MSPSTTKALKPVGAKITRFMIAQIAERKPLAEIVYSSRVMALELVKEMPGDAKDEIVTDWLLALVASIGKESVSEAIAEVDEAIAEKDKQ